MAAFVDVAAVALGTQRTQSSLGCRFRRPRAETLHSPAAARAGNQFVLMRVYSGPRLCVRVRARVCTSIYV